MKLPKLPNDLGVSDMSESELDLIAETTGGSIGTINTYRYITSEIPDRYGYGFRWLGTSVPAVKRLVAFSKIASKHELLVKGKVSKLLSKHSFLTEDIATDIIRVSSSRRGGHGTKIIDFVCHNYNRPEVMENLPKTNAEHRAWVRQHKLKVVLNLKRLELADKIIKAINRGRRK